MFTLIAYLSMNYFLPEVNGFLMILPFFTDLFVIAAMGRPNNASNNKRDF